MNEKALVRKKTTLKKKRVSSGRSLWLELEPWGISVGHEEPRPSLLFKVVGSEQVIPIFISSSEAAVVLSRNQAQQSSPHGASLLMFEHLGYKANECRFVDLQGHHVYVEVNLTGTKRGKKPQVVRARADQALSFCLESGAKFLCQESLLRKMRDLKLDMDALTQGFMGHQDDEKKRPLYLN